MKEHKVIDYTSLKEGKGRISSRGELQTVLPPVDFLNALFITNYPTCYCPDQVIYLTAKVGR